MAKKSEIHNKDTLAIKKKKRKLTNSDRQLYSLCLIPIILVFIFKYIPMFGIVLAFKNYRFNLGILGSPWVGFSNFEFFLKSNVFIQLIRNTLFNNALFIAFGIISSLIVAILLFEIKSRNKTKVFQTMMITPHFISMVIVAYIVYAILNPNYGEGFSLYDTCGLNDFDNYLECLMPN